MATKNQNNSSVALTEESTDTKSNLRLCVCGESYAPAGSTLCDACYEQHIAELTDVEYDAAFNPNRDI